jgi:hypothetical protein
MIHMVLLMDSKLSGECAASIVTVAVSSGLCMHIARIIYWWGEEIEPDWDQRKQ